MSRNFGQGEHIYGLVHLGGIFVPDDMAAGDTEAVYDPVMLANVRNVYGLYASIRESLLKEVHARVVLVSSLAFAGGAWSYCLQRCKGSSGRNGALTGQKGSAKYSG
jgi:hypothetical protein